MLCSVEGLTCIACTPKNDTKEEIARAAREREMNGCEKDTPAPQFGDSETGENFYRCPLALLTPEAVGVIELLEMMSVGFLPSLGGVLEQGAHILSRVRYARNQKMQMLEQKEKK